MRSKWEKRVVQYAKDHHDAYPSFKDFNAVVQEQAKLKNHPNVLVSVSLSNERQRTRSHKSRYQNVPATYTETDRRVLKSSTANVETRDSQRSSSEEDKCCLFHQRKGHCLNECKAFDRGTLEGKTEYIMKAGLCFRCLSHGHRSNECPVTVKCAKCGDDRHPTVLHKEKPEEPRRKHGEEIQSVCTSLCSDSHSGGLSCSKIVLVDVFSDDQPQKFHRVYAILDDQSNASMISPRLVNKLGGSGPSLKYFLSTCSGGRQEKSGRRVSGISVCSMAGKTSRLPQLIECASIPQDKREIATPEMVMQFPHLRKIAEEIPPYDPKATVDILIGRDAPELLKIRASKNGPKGAPWAQKMDLGWTMSGELCLDRVDGPVHISARRTAVECPVRLNSGPWSTQEALSSPTEYQVVPCPNHFKIRETYSQKGEIGTDLFQTRTDDNMVGMSQDDQRFLEIMEAGINKNEQGNWEMPLPFRSPNIRMPNNRPLAVNRLNGLLRTLKRKPKMKEDYFQFMSKVFEYGHAVPVQVEETSSSRSSHPNERSQPTSPADRTLGDIKDGHLWYLYHPRKPDQIRVVFDSSAEYQGTSLNKELLPGPDLMNNLTGVLVRFREENIATMCDIEQMFHSFHVKPEHQNFLRFLWFKDNDPSKEIVENKMTVRLFGNGPSPAIATFGLRKTAENSFLASRTYPFSADIIQKTLVTSHEEKYMHFRMRARKPLEPWSTCARSTREEL